MFAKACLALILLTLLAGCGDKDDSGGGPDPYSGLVDSPIRGLSPEEIESLRAGAGMRLALPAELNTYPGPKHVLELGDELGLSGEQRATFEELYEETNREARRVGDVLLERFGALDAYFRAGGSNETELASLTEEIGALEGDLRLVHLRAHMRSLPLLTEHQRALYAELRGYGTADHAAHTH